MSTLIKDRGGLDYPFPQIPEPAQITEVADGVYWLRMPLPLALDHINLWLLAGPEGWTLVDCGMATDRTRELWKALFTGAAAQRPPSDLIVTHFHPDHMGLAGWLVEEYGLPLRMTESEYRTGCMVKALSETDFLAALEAFFLPHGFDPALMRKLAAYGNAYAHSVDTPPQAFTAIADHEELDIGGHSWKVIVGRGHAPEHAALYCAERGVLICGDLLLPEITPNISTEFFDPEPDHLALYLDSLKRFEHLPEDTLVLPSHRLPYRGLHRRIGQLAAHHEERLQRILKVADAQARCAFDYLPVLFDRKLEGYQNFFAMGEAIAHLDHLVKRGELSEERGAGRIRYRKA